METRDAAAPTAAAGEPRRHPGRWLPVAALAAGAAVLALTTVLADVVDQPISTFTRDWQVTADAAWYVGAVSILNGMVWATTAGLSFLAAWLAPAQRGRLVGLGTLVLVLAADDALLLHETIGPLLGVPQELILAGYAALTAVLLIAFLRPPRDLVCAVFVLGAALLGASVALDQFAEGRHLLEDGAKLLGALTWLTVPVLVVLRRPDGR
ncbi:MULTISPECIES: hypothetical protein [unclassified Blastococcus]